MSLSMLQVVRQSTLCHPDWTLSDHVEYLRVELAFSTLSIEASMRTLKRVMDETKKEMQDA